MDYERICARVKAQEKMYLTQQEVAELCHLSKKTVYKLEQSGALPYEECVDQLIHTHKIKTKDVLAMLEKRYCRQPCGSLYMQVMSGYYKKLLKKEPGALELCDVMRLTGFSKSGVLSWLIKGKLPSIRSGRCYLVPKRYLLAFLLSSEYRSIKNKSAKQKNDLLEIEAQIGTALKGGGYDEQL